MTLLAALFLSLTEVSIFGRATAHGFRRQSQAPEGQQETHRPAETGTEVGAAAGKAGGHGGTSGTGLEAGNTRRRHRARASFVLTPWHWSV